MGKALVAEDARQGREREEVAPLGEPGLREGADTVEVRVKRMLVHRLAHVETLRIELRYPIALLFYPCRNVLLLPVGCRPFRDIRRTAPAHSQRLSAPAVMPSERAKPAAPVPKKAADPSTGTLRAAAFDAVTVAVA